MHTDALPRAPDGGTCLEQQLHRLVACEEMRVAPVGVVDRRLVAVALLRNLTSSLGVRESATSCSVPAHSGVARVAPS